MVKIAILSEELVERLALLRMRMINRNFGEPSLEDVLRIVIEEGLKEVEHVVNIFVPHPDEDDCIVISEGSERVRCVAVFDD